MTHDWSSASRGKRQCYKCEMWQYVEDGRWEYQLNHLPIAVQEYLSTHERLYHISCDLILALKNLDLIEYRAEREGKGDVPEEIYLTWDSPSAIVNQYKKMKEVKKDG